LVERTDSLRRGFLAKHDGGRAPEEGGHAHEEQKGEEDYVWHHQEKAPCDMGDHLPPRRSCCGLRPLFIASRRGRRLRLTGRRTILWFRCSREWHLCPPRGH